MSAAETIDPRQAQIWREDWPPGRPFARTWAPYVHAQTIVAGRVLDVGCGMGEGIALLSRRADFAVGMDASPQRVRDAPDYNRGAPVHWCAGSAEALPFAPASFDTVVCSHVLEHLSDQPRAVRELRRALAPHGQLLLATPNAAQSPGPYPPHRHELRAEELRALLSAEFAEVEMLPVEGTELMLRRRELMQETARPWLRLDVLRLRERLPQAWREWLFHRLQPRLRRQVQAQMPSTKAPEDGFIVGDGDLAQAFDFFCICRGGRR